MSKNRKEYPVNRRHGQPVYVGVRVVGVVEGDVFYKRLSGSKHFLRTPPAIAVDVSALNQAINAGATRLWVYDIDTDTDYYATVESVHLRGFTFNRGFGDQIGLVLSHWTIRRRGQPGQASLFS